MITFYPGTTGEIIQHTLTQLTAGAVIERIWDFDHTVWSLYPDDILNRLGWLNISETMLPHIDSINALADDIRADGITEVVVLGMGGASLVAEVFDSVFHNAQSGIKVTVLDTTHPDTIHMLQQRLDLSKTLFIYSMKKWALETYSLLKYFYNAVLTEVGQEQVGQHFITITDVGAWVAPFAEKLNFREIIFNDPMIGGRYAALSHVGLVPAALRGVDITRLLSQAHHMTERCKLLDLSPDQNTGGWLGAVIGGLARAGRDKLTFVASPGTASWLTWVEQLLAESTGKSGTGILPVIEHHVAGPEMYSDDRVFVFLEDRGVYGDDFAKMVQAFAVSQYPVIHIQLKDAYDIGQQFVLWCMAVAVAGHVLNIQPFDQPDVEATKVETTSLLEQYEQSGAFPDHNTVLEQRGIRLIGDVSGNTLEEILRAFISQVKRRDYIAVHAYLSPETSTTRQLQALQNALRDSSGCAVTTAYAPRFLHSTGQLHKGDRGNGHFIQITSDSELELPAPSVAGAQQSNYPFGVLLEAQATGDWLALRQRQRHVIRLHLAVDIETGLKTLLDILRD